MLKPGLIWTRAATGLVAKRSDHPSKPRLVRDETLHNHCHVRSRNPRLLRMPIARPKTEGSRVQYSTQHFYFATTGAFWAPVCRDGFTVAKGICAEKQSRRLSLRRGFGIFLAFQAGVRRAARRMEEDLQREETRVSVCDPSLPRCTLSGLGKERLLFFLAIQEESFPA